jgi:hypothetical protein
VDNESECRERSANLTVLVLGGLVLAACAQPRQPSLSAPTAATLMLDWVPNTNHTGIFVAQAEDISSKPGCRSDYPAGRGLPDRRWLERGRLRDQPGAGDAGAGGLVPIV